MQCLNDEQIQTCTVLLPLLLYRTHIDIQWIHYYVEKSQISKLLGKFSKIHGSKNN